MSSNSNKVSDDAISQREGTAVSDAMEALNEPKSVLLVSTMKSGTHWLRYLFANYVKLLNAPNPDEVRPVVYDGLQSRFHQQTGA